MRIVYALQDQNISIEILDANLDKYFQKVGIPAGAIYLSRPLYNNLLGIMFQVPRVQILPISKIPYVLHLITTYGVVPVFCDNNNWHNDISLELSPDFEKEFEKIVLGEKK
jgi:hypothetical protein